MKLLADIGGTNSRFTLANDNNELSHLHKSANKDFATFELALEKYIDTLPQNLEIQSAAICIAAPVKLGKKIKLTNLSWIFDRKSICDILDIKELHIINDFEAIALALPSLNKTQYISLGSESSTSQDHSNENMAVLGPGTGLGVASLMYSPSGWLPVTGEGGHVTLAPMNALEDKVIQHLRNEFSHVSGERLVNGSGLALLYKTLSLFETGTAITIQPHEVSLKASQGDDIAIKTIEVFISFLANLAGNLALTVGAHGGVFIAGGVSLALKDDIMSSNFRQSFINKGRFDQYLNNIPTYLITEPTPAFVGLLTLFKY